ncbi:MAG: hypothetical protein RI980_1375 [Bacteroidota bacterium]|jgi:hypothetical protein
MEIKVKIPIKADIVFQGLPIITSAAGSGTTWTKEQLGDYADRSGVNIHHCDGKILYVGKTTSGQERKKRPHNTHLASWWVTCLNSSSVFQLECSAGGKVLCSEIQHERQAWER